MSEFDFPSFLVGNWKRTLEWRGFGGDFEAFRTTNSVVKIEDDADAIAEPETRFLKWSFSKNLDDFVAAYSMHFIPQSEAGYYYMDWTFQGLPCQGKTFAVRRRCYYKLTSLLYQAISIRAAMLLLLTSALNQQS